LVSSGPDTSNCLLHKVTSHSRSSLCSTAYVAHPIRRPARLWDIPRRLSKTFLPPFSLTGFSPSPPTGTAACLVCGDARVAAREAGSWWGGRARGGPAVGRPQPRDVPRFARGCRGCPQTAPVSQTPSQHGSERCLVPGSQHLRWVRIPGRPLPMLRLAARCPPAWQCHPSFAGSSAGLIQLGAGFSPTSESCRTGPKGCRFTPYLRAQSVFLGWWSC